MTKGERRVALHFNPSGRDAVSQIKGVTATLIDNLENYTLELLDEDMSDMDTEAIRWASIAQTKYEEACMFAVKALTATNEVSNG